MLFQDENKDIFKTLIPPFVHDFRTEYTRIFKLTDFAGQCTSIDRATVPSERVNATLNKRNRNINDRGISVAGEGRNRDQFITRAAGPSRLSQSLGTVTWITNRFGR